MTKEYWKERMAQWESSSKSMAEFCRHEELSYWTFRQWRKRLINHPEADLVKLDTEKPPLKMTESRLFQVNLKGISITIPQDYDEKLFLRIISSLRKLP